MNHSDSYVLPRRWMAGIAAAALLFSWVGFVPRASAAQALTSFVEALPNAIDPSAGETLDIKVETADTTDDVTVDFYVRGPLEADTPEEQLVDSYTYTTTPSQEHTFFWDGTWPDSGVYVEFGTYELRFEGTGLIDDDPVDLTDTIGVSSPVQMITHMPPHPYYNGNGGMDFIFEVEQISERACVTLMIDGENIDATGVDVDATGEYGINWDGMLGGDVAVPGEYEWQLYAWPDMCDASFTMKSGTLGGDTLLVVEGEQPMPYIASLGVNPSPFDPADGPTSLEYELVDSLGYSTLHFEVYPLGDDGDVLFEQTVLNAENGEFALEWDGMVDGEPVADGEYVLKIWGMDASEEIAVVTVNFTVAAMEEEPEEEPTEEEEGEMCGGYSDVPADHPDCDAIEYVQSIGAMEGNPDGTLQPDQILQRDQVAKISLETFGLFDEEMDYCEGENPFPDVVVGEAWSAQYVCRGVELGLITGYESGPEAGMFLPSRGVNRVEFLALMLRNLDEGELPSEDSVSYSDVEPGQWFSGYAKYSMDNSLFVGVNLMPEQGTMRSEVADVIYKLHNAGAV